MLVMLTELLSGLALFLFGMKFMSEGLQKAAGDKMRVILDRVTKNRFVAVFFGAIFTAIIQSSGATTVMEVSFVNAGLLTLEQSVGITFGANIGTTITAQLVSLKLTAIAPYIIFVGACLMMFGNKPITRKISEVIFGFGALFLGINSMTGALSRIPEYPVIMHWFSYLKNPFIALLVGLIFTVAVQSSSVTVSVLVLLADSHLVGLGSCLYFILGANIGSCTPAVMAAMNANKNAKRAAMMHLYFNLIGTVVFMILFYLINAAVHFPFMTQMATPATIAITHSVFNITATLVWLPFSNLLVKLACLTIRDDKKDEVSKEDQEFMILESRFLEKPAFAVEQGRNAARQMEKDSRKALNIALDLIYDYSEEQAERVQKIESKVDRYEDELGTYLVKLNNKNLSERDSHSVSTMLHCIGDFERISDHAVNIMESAQELHEKNLTFSAQARNELQVLIAAVSRIVDTAYQIFDKQDLNLTEDVEPLEEIVDELSKELKRRHINRLRSGECTIEMGFILTDLLTSLERIADHCSNISVCITQVRENLYDTHSHLESMKNEPDDAYYNRLEELQKEYVLP